MSKREGAAQPLKVIKITGLVRAIEWRLRKACAAVLLFNLRHLWPGQPRD